MKKIIILAAVLILKALLMASGCSQPASRKAPPEDKSNESKTKVLEEYEGKLGKNYRRDAEVIHKLKRQRVFYL